MQYQMKSKNFIIYIIYSTEESSDLTYQSSISHKINKNKYNESENNRKINVFLDGTITECGGYIKTVLDIPTKKQDQNALINNKVNSN